MYDNLNISVLSGSGDAYLGHWPSVIAVMLNTTHDFVLNEDSKNSHMVPWIQNILPEFCFSPVFRFQWVVISVECFQCINFYSSYIAALTHILQRNTCIGSMSRDLSTRLPFKSYFLANQCQIFIHIRRSCFCVKYMSAPVPVALSWGVFVYPVVDSSVDPRG